MERIFLKGEIRKIAAAILFVFVFLLPMSAQCEIRAGSFEITPFAGYNFFENDQNLKDRPVYGGRLGYNFTRHFGIELSGEFINTKVDDRARRNLSEGQFGGPTDKVRITFYNVDAVYHFMPDGKVNPYISAGFGGTHYSPSISTKDMANIDFGIGAKTWLTDNIALRIDFRDHMVSEIFQESYHNLQATLGIVFAFGGRPKIAPVATAKSEAPIFIVASDPASEEKITAVAISPKTEMPEVVLAFEDIHFDFDKSTLTEEAQEILDKTIRLLRDNPKARIRIAGYTSASGTDEYNQKLSERRAEAVFDYLTEEGSIPSERLAKIGYGEMRPAMYEPIPEQIYSTEAKANMRVLFEVIVK
jgi:OOP family OmpA-OmpF porin